MKRILLLGLLVFFLPWKAPASTKILNLNVFDQLQGQWEPDFREQRMAALSKWIRKNKPDIVVFQEARGEESGDKRGGKESSDTKGFRKSYPHRFYTHEMTGADKASYGYWIGSRKAWKRNWVEGFSFPGGVDRRVQAAIWTDKKSCFGILSLHLSYQNSEVRQKEAHWILDWLRSHEKDCASWLIVGDFNADEESAEIKILLDGGLKSLYAEKKPTVGAFNPIRRIYGKDIPSKTIDWAFGWNLKGEAKVIFDAPLEEQWLSDHAGIWIELK